MSQSAIEWTEHTWNPIVGCSIVSPGCTHCYAMKMAARIGAMKRSHYDGTTHKVKGKAIWTGRLALAPDNILLAPLRRKTPTVYFVNSMGDLFHEDCPDEWIDKVFAVMALAPQHTFQVLTKRAGRMRDYMLTPHRKRTIAEHAMPISCMLARDGGHRARIKLDHFSACFAGGGPFKNVWLGVSTERQQEADERIPLLLQTPAAVRFISAEPLLGAIDLIGTLARYQDTPGRRCAVPLGRQLIEWVIVGGESGHDGRPMHPDWARSLRDQCAAAGVPFFFKQWGAWEQIFGSPMFHDKASRGHGLQTIKFEDGVCMGFVGKKRAGRLLDGKEHNGFPAMAKARAA